MNFKNEFRDSLECTICSNLFKNPKQLFCGHTFCLDCIKKLENDSKQYITCPNCREITYVPKKGLSTNYVILDLAMKIENIDLNFEEVEKCFLCQKLIKKTETLFCRTCLDIHLCSICALKSHKEHKIDWLIDLNLLKQKENSEIFINNLVKCSKKSANEILMHCDLFSLSINQIYDLVSNKLLIFDKILKQIADSNNKILEEDLCHFIKQAYQIYSSITTISTDFNHFFNEFHNQINHFEKVLNLNDEINLINNEKLCDIFKQIILPPSLLSINSSLTESKIMNPFSYDEESSKHKTRRRNLKSKLKNIT